MKLRHQGIDPNDLGTHSFRKGAATYCSSGSTAGPSSSAIHLRAGWAMGGVQDTYIRYEAAGDMYVGRVVAGLPVDKPEFDTIGPRFVDSAGDIVMRYIRIVFPGMPLNLFCIAEQALASLVYHSSFILATLPQGHPATQSLLFRDITILQTLEPLVVCSLNNTDICMPATGIPPHTYLLRELSTMKDQFQELVPVINATGKIFIALMSRKKDRG